LEGFIQAHFDTTTGPKIDPKSYEWIAKALGLVPGSILFISDTEGELVAAQQAGLRVALCARSGAVRTSDTPVVTSFDTVFP
jgi:enolase-phosphatase E1